jgi:hypothetical protein
MKRASRRPPWGNAEIGSYPGAERNQTSLDRHADLATAVEPQRTRRRFAVKQYSAEVTWLVPEYVTLTVKAETPREAIERALAEVARDPDRYERKFDYDTCGPDIVTGLWEGPEAYPADPAREVALPPTPTTALEAAIEAAVHHARAGASAPPEIHALIEAFDAWREAR